MELLPGQKTSPSADQPPVVIGAPVNRTDGRLKVTGGARYSAEVSLPELFYGVVVSSTVACGTIVRMDTAAAEQAPGVLVVFTPFHAPKLPKHSAMSKGFNPSERQLRVLEDNVVYYFLQPIGVVVADTLERTTHAAELVRVQYQEGQAVAGLVAHLASAYQPDNAAGGQGQTATPQDADTALRSAPVQIAQVYQTPVEHHAATDPHATVASWKGDRLTVFDATQGIFGTQHRLAGLFGLPDENVRVVCPYVGGGFGSKGPVWSHTVLAALCARAVGRRVKIALIRRQVFNNTGSRAHTYQDFAAGADRDGKLLALRARQHFPYADL